MKTHHVAPNAPAAIGPYCHAVEANGFVFTSGQTGVNPETGKLLETLEEQSKQVLENLSNVLGFVGCSMNDVVKSLVFLTDMNDFAVVNGIYKEAFNLQFPARSCVQVSKLPGGALVEIEMIALKP